jgi:hypothetical protein
LLTAKNQEQKWQLLEVETVTQPGEAWNADEEQGEVREVQT